MLPQPAGLFGGNASSLGTLADSLRDALTSTPSGRQLLGNLIGRYGGDDPGRPSDPDVVAQATHDLARTDLTAELPKISAPMTVLFAAAPKSSPDHARAVEEYRRAYAGARTARLRPVAESGHMIMYDQPAKFREEMKRFLED
jgi:N-formylmaleamate deformylase